MSKVCRLCMLVLFLFFLLPESVQSAQPQPLYAALGVEAYGILRELVGSDHVLSIQIGTMPAILDQYRISAFVVPENRQNDPDVILARKAGLRIVTVLRHTDIANITTNITTLGALTGQDDKATVWIKNINLQLAQIRQDIHDKPQVRVLILSPEGYTQGKGALITNILANLRGINVAAEAGIPEARQISDDQIRQFAPDVVLLLNWSPQLVEKLSHNPLYNGLPAFDHQRIYRIATPGKNIAQLTTELRNLADLIHIWII